MRGATGQENRTGGGLLDKAAWLFFCATCIQLGFLQPSVVLVHGERTNLFSGLFCAIAVLGALLVAKKRKPAWTMPELLISLGLLTLGLASAAVNWPPWSPMFRILVLMASGLGGFWCARILLNSDSRVKAFVWLCTGILLAQALAGLWGYHLYGKVEHFIYTNVHPVIGMMFLLSIGPLALLASRKPLMVAAGIFVAAVTYLALFAAGVQVVSSAMLIPLVLVIFVAVLQVWGSRQTAGLLILVMVMTGLSTYFVSYLSPKHYSDPKYQAYRIESYPFAWHIAEKHPLFGIGLRSPRDQYLSDYSMRNPFLTEAQFRQTLKTSVTQENTFLTFMAGVGLPFVVLFAVGLFAVLLKLVRITFRGLPVFSLEPWVLLIPILGGLMDSLVVDTLLYPQIAWFLCMLLGLVPARVPEPAAEASRRRFAMANVGWIVGAIVLGVILGTHPAFSPERLPTSQQIREYAENLPIIKALVSKNVPAPPVSRSAAPKAGHKVASRNNRAVMKRSPISTPGRLTVNLDGQEAWTVPWAVMLIVDNSRSMLPTQNPHHIDGRRIAEELTCELAKDRPPGCAVGLRNFGPETIRRAEHKVPIRVSHIAWRWVDSPPNESHVPSFPVTQWTGENDLLHAVTHAVKTDFCSAPQRNRRVALITDGLGNRLNVTALASMLKVYGKEKVALDIIAIGLKRPDDEEYSRTIESGKGIFLKLSEPEQVKPTVGEYLRLLAGSMEPKIEVFGSSRAWTLDRGQTISLTPGSYSMLLPQFRGESSRERLVEDVKISSGMTTSLDVGVANGRVQVRRSESHSGDSDPQ